MNTTSDDGRVGWVAPNCGRGTLQLIYNCLCTIFICTYTVFHDEVYSHQRLYRRLWWMMIAIFMPEFVMLRALRQHIEARDLTNLMLLQRRWSIHHSWLTNMGGIKLIWINPQIVKSLENTSYFTHVSQRGELLVTPNGELLLTPNDAFKASEPDDSPPASGHQLHWLLQRKKVDIDTFPTIADIRDKSKHSYLLKGLACFQAIWFVVTLLTRTSQVLPISTLEVSTLSYVVCSFATHGLWWRKPYDVEIPIRVPCKMLNEDEEEEFKKVKDLQRDNDTPPYALKFWNLRLLMQRFPSYHSECFKYGMLAISTVFGGIHLVAWSDMLPTVAEDILWRACSMLTTITAPALFFIIQSYDYLHLPEKSMAGRLRCGSMFCVAGLYILVRLTLTIEPFMELRAAPVGIYQQGLWVTFIPQIF